MPKWRRYFHAFAAGFMCVAFVCVGCVAVRGFFPSAAEPRTKGLFIAGAAMIAMVIFCIGGQVWFRRRMIAEFSFDGSALRFRTLGNPEMETRDLSQIAEVRDWRGRGTPLGYRLKFRDGRKFYLEYSVSNSAAIAEEIRYGLACKFV